MTIATTTSRVDYTGNGSSTAFSVPFPFFDQTELIVVERVIATGAETTLALSTNYTVSGGDGAAGTVTAVVAPAATKQWTILRNTRRTQEVDYLPNDAFPAETHERALDRLTALVQENERDAARGLRIAVTDPGGSLTLPTSVDRANHVLGFNAAGEPVAVVPEAGSLVITPYAQTLLDDTTAALARGTLGSGAGGDAVFTAASAAAARTALGASTVGAGVFVAADTAAARLAINGAAQPTTSPSTPGSEQAINSGSGSPLLAPAGGTWVSKWFGITTATGAVTGTPEMAETAGGATLKAGSAGIAYYGWTKRKL